MPIKINVEHTNKRQRRHIRDLPQSSEFIFTSDNDDQYLHEDTTGRNQAAMTTEKTVLSAPSPIKKEPIEQGQVGLRRCYRLTNCILCTFQVPTEPKKESMEINVWFLRQDRDSSFSSPVLFR